jgi:phage-related protein
VSTSSAATATLKMLLLGEDRSASKALHGAGTEAEKSGTKFGKFGKVAAAALVATAAAAVAFGKASVDAYKTAASESSQLARVTGATITQASQLRFAAEETGVSFSSLSLGMKTFSKNLGGAAGDAKKSAAMVAQLGFSFKDAEGNIKPTADLLPQLADKFKNMADGPAKTALAMKLFGKQGAEMIKTLNKGSDGLAEFAAMSDKTGNTLNDTSAYKKQLQAQREFHAAISGVKIQLGQALMPVLTAFSLFLVAHVAPALADVSGWISHHQTLIAALVPIVMGLAGAMGAIAIATKIWSGVTKVASAVSKVFAAAQWLVNAALDANPIGLVVIGIAALIAILIIAWKKSDTFRHIVTGAFNAVWGAAKTAFGWIKQNWPLLLAILTGPIGLAVLVIARNWDKIKAAASAVVHWIGSEFGKLPGQIGALAGKMLNAGKDLVGAIWKGFLNGAKAAGGFIGDLVNSIKEAINNVLGLPLQINFDKGPIHIHATLIPAFANGVRNFAGGVALVGEAGPELVSLPRGANVYSNRESRGMGGDPGYVVVVVQSEDGRVIQKKLLKVKRDNGGGQLGIA